MKKFFSTLLARIFFHPAAHRLPIFIRQFFFSFAVHPKNTSARIKKLTPLNIGIWQPKIIDGEQVFIRPPQGPYGDHYSHEKIIPLSKRGDTLRICYFGESVALGYLFAPNFYPAKHLEQLLNQTTTQKFDVIDLSQTNETLDGILEKFSAAMQLSPDICIIFAGNNWPLLEQPEASPHHPGIISRQTIADILANGGYDALADKVVMSRLAKAGKTLEIINEISIRYNTKVILVIPEVNLADWESKQPVPHLNGDKINQWHFYYQEAQQYIHDESWEKLLDTGFAMWDIDQGTSSTTYRLIHIAHMNLGNSEQAKAAAHAEIDSICLPYMIFLNAPQITRYDQNLLRRVALHHGYGLVDLPNVLVQTSPNQIVGREFFLDYCHLTKHGIEIIIRAIAEEVTRILNINFNKQEAVSIFAQINPEHEALAQFGAAIHTAHRLNSVSNKAPILRYWCQRALDTSPAIQSAMLDFVSARLSGIPVVLTPEQQKLMNTPYNLLYSHGWKYNNLDIELILAIQEVLKANTRNVEESITTKMLRYHAVEDFEYDLSSTVKYLWNPLEQSYIDLLEVDAQGASVIYRAFWRHSDFILISKDNSALQINLAARVLHQHSQSNLHLQINSHTTDAQKISSKFQRYQFSIPKEHLLPGANKLSILWPELPAHHDGYKVAVQKLRSGTSVDLAPIFGEIFSLTANKLT